MKRSAESTARRAFAIFALLVLLIAGAWYFVSGARYATYLIRTNEPVSGLLVDSPVEMLGVEVGKVDRISLVDPRTVEVRLRVRRETPVTGTTVATITARGLTNRGFMGYVYVALDDDGSNSQPLAAQPGEEWPQIPAAPPRSFSLDTAFDKVNGNVQALTDIARSTLDEQNLASLRRSLDDLRQFTQVLAASNQKLEAIISNTERAARDVKPLLESGNDTVRAMQTQLLPKAYRTLDDLEKLSRTMNDTVSRTARDPSVLIRGSRPLPPGPGERDESR